MSRRSKAPAVDTELLKKREADVQARIDAAVATYVAELRVRLVNSMVVRAVDGARDGTLLRNFEIATTAIDDAKVAIPQGVLSALVEQANEVGYVLAGEHARLTKK